MLSLWTLVLRDILRGSIFQTFVSKFGQSTRRRSFSPNKTRPNQLPRPTPRYTRMHQRIQLAVGDMSMCCWKPIISLTHPPNPPPPHTQHVVHLVQCCSWFFSNFFFWIFGIKQIINSCSLYLRIYIYGENWRKHLVMFKGIDCLLLSTVCLSLFTV